MITLRGTVSEMMVETSNHQEAEVEESTFLDMKKLGRLIRGHRYIKGFENGLEFVDIQHQRTGVSLSDRSLYEYERGGRVPTAPTMDALIVVLGIKLSEYAECINDEVVRREFERLMCDE